MLLLPTFDYDDETVEENAEKFYTSSLTAFAQRFFIAAQPLNNRKDYFSSKKPKTCFDNSFSSTPIGIHNQSFSFLAKNSNIHL